MKILSFIIILSLFLGNNGYCLRVPVGDAKVRSRIKASTKSKKDYPLDKFHEENKGKDIEEWDYETLVDLLMPIIETIISRFNCKDILTERGIGQEDILIEVVDAVYIGYKTFRRDGKFSSWIYVIVRNKIVAELRKYFKEAKALARKVPSKRELYKDYGYSGFLRGNLKFLTGYQKKIIKLYLEVKNFRQIADILGVAESNVEYNYSFSISKIISLRLIQREKLRCLEILKKEPGIVSNRIREVMIPWVEGKSMQEIATDFDLTDVAVRSRIRKGIKAVDYKKPNERIFYGTLFEKYPDILTDKQKQIIELWIQNYKLSRIAKELDVIDVTGALRRAKVRLIKASGIYRVMYDSSFEDEALLGRVRRDL